MWRILITTSFFIGAGTAAIAAPHYDNQVFWGDSTETGELAPMPEDWVQDTIDAAKADADEMAAIARKEGIPVAPDRNEIVHRVHFQSPEIVSLLREDWAYEGGASGTLWLVPVNWDARADALIPIQSIFGDPANSQPAYDRVAAMLREATVEQVWDGDAGDWHEAIDAAIRPDPMYLSTFTFLPSTVPGRIGGIAWHFEPDMIAPGAEGPVSVVIAQENLRETIAPEWRDLFAGKPAAIPDAHYVSSGNDRLLGVLARH